MIEVDCKKCKNLSDDGCSLYGNDADIAVIKCAENCFANYKIIKEVPTEEEQMLENVRNAIKTITSGKVYDDNGYITEEGRKALEELDGLDLFWICDPRIKLV